MTFKFLHFQNRALQLAAFNDLVSFFNVNEPKQRTIFLSDCTNLNNILLTLVAMYAKSHGIYLRDINNSVLQ